MESGTHLQKVCKRHREPLSELKTTATPFPTGCEQKAPGRDVQATSLVKCLTKSLVDLFLSSICLCSPGLAGQKEEEVS